MNQQFVFNIVQTVSTIALLIGVGLVVWELQQSREISISERLTTSADVETNLRDLLAENAELWHKGCLGTDMSESESVAYTQLVFAVFFKNFMRHHISKTSLASADEITFVGIMARNIHHFPGFRDAWQKIPRDIYTWEPLIQAELERLKQLNPAPLPIEACGLG